MASPNSRSDAIGLLWWRWNRDTRGQNEHERPHSPRVVVYMPNKAHHLVYQKCTGTRAIGCEGTEYGLRQITGTGTALHDIRSASSNGRERASLIEPFSPPLWTSLWLSNSPPPGKRETAHKRHFMWKITSRTPHPTELAVASRPTSHRSTVIFPGLDTTGKLSTPSSTRPRVPS